MLAFLGSLGAIILVDLALSGDNALVIGAAAAGLSRRRRLLAIIAGGGAAVVLRVLFAAAATLLLVLPLLEAIGGVILLIVAARLLMGREHEQEAVQDTPAGATPKEPSLMQALLTILIADVTMSLDNILAVGGLAHGNLELLAVGLVISIALLMVGSAVIAELIGRLPWLLDLAALTLGWTGASMALHDHIVGAYLQRLPYAAILVPATGVVLVLLVDILLRVRASSARRAASSTAEAAERADETTSVL